METTEPTRASEPAEPRLAVFPKRLLFLGLAAAVLYAARAFGLPWSRAGLAALLLLLVLESLLRWLVARRQPLFEKALLAQLGTASAEELLGLYRRQLLLRFAAPRHYMLGRLALIHDKAGHHRLAAAAYREALEEAPSAERLQLSLGLARSLERAGDSARVEQLYRSLISEAAENPRVLVGLARMVRARGGEQEEAERLLRAAIEAGARGEARCELAVLLAERGEQEEARAELERAETELAGASRERRKCLDEARAALKQD